MKKVLLINPRFTEEVSIFSVPTSLLYLGSWLTHKGYGVSIVDALHFKDEGDLRDWIKGEVLDSDYVGFTVMSTQIPHALELSKLVKRLSSIPIVWGGAHPTLYPEQTVKHPSVDYVVKGDGEYFLESLLREGKLEGSSFNVDENYSINWNLLKSLEPEMSLKEMSNLTEFGMPILSSRGCPHKCNFCINSILSTKYRRRSLDLVLRDIEEALAQGFTRLEFVDECLLAGKGRVSELINRIEKKKLKFEWVASSRVDYFKDSYLGEVNFLKKLRQSGCWFIGTGAESGSQRILDKINKGVKVRDTINMAKKLGEAGIKGDFSFMIGLPGETKEDYKATLSLIYTLTKVNPSVYILGPQIYRPYPGSMLYEECKKYGMEEPGTLERWSKSPYIHFEFSSKSFFNKKLYPWVQFRGDLTTLVFYATLMGVRPRFKPMTFLLRLIGRIRCKLFFFRFPVLKWIYGALRGSAIETQLRKRGII